MFLEIAQNSQENTCARDFIKKETLVEVLSYEFRKISENTFFTEHLRWLLLNQSLNFAENYMKVSGEDEAFIKYAKNSLFYNDQKNWIKKRRIIWCNDSAYDGAEVCELAGIFIQYQIPLKYNRNSIGVYRDDGLAVFKICKMFTSRKN